MAGGKGGSTTSSVSIPEYIEEAAKQNLAKAEGISQIGYVPYYGPSVAAFTPFQQAGFSPNSAVVIVYPYRSMFVLMCAHTVESDGVCLK